MPIIWWALSGSPRSRQTIVAALEAAGLQEPARDQRLGGFSTHLEWAASPPLPPPSYYKWFLALHQVGNEAVAAKARVYRAGMERRSRAAAALGCILPAVGIQAILARLAGTDWIVQLDYQKRIRAYLRRLRSFYYAYMFHDLPFRKAGFAKAPRFRLTERIVIYS